MGSLSTDNTSGLTLFLITRKTVQEEQYAPVHMLYDRFNWTFAQIRYTMSAATLSVSLVNRKGVKASIRCSWCLLRQKCLSADRGYYLLSVECICVKWPQLYNDWQKIWEQQQTDVAFAKEDVLLDFIAMALLSLKLNP